MAEFIALPSNVEAERSVLGAMLIAPEAAEIALGSLMENDFSDADPRNKLIFRAAMALHEHDRPIDAQTIIDELITLKLDKSVESNYIFDLVSTVITPENIDQYIMMVREQSVLRELLLKCQEIQKTYSAGVADIGSFIAKSNNEISLIAQKRAVQDMRSAKDVAEEVSRHLKKASAADKHGLTGIDTGYKKLNAYTHGWQKGDFIILAARPSVGKTALGMNFAYNAAIYSHVPVAFFSLEMGATQVMQRLIASRSYVSNDKIQTGWLNANDKVKIVSAIDEISHTEIFFDDTPNAKLGDVIAKATRLKNTHPNLGLIVIDYLGRIRYSDKADLSARQMEVSYVSGALKTLARTLDVPVICLAQLNRNVESSESKVPALSNLRESGSIEQDADIVMLMYRKDYYRDLGQQTKEKGWAKDKKGGDQPQTQLAQPTTEDSTDNTGGMSDVKVLVAKNRNGQTGQVTLLFQKAFSRFDDPSPEYEEAEARAAAEGGE